MDTPTRVRQILLTRGLSLFQVSRLSSEMFGRRSPYCISEHLYHDISVARRCPSIYQFAALSQISGYRISDWLSVFGFDLDDIPRLQLAIPWRRTVLLDSTTYDDRCWVPWFTGTSSEVSFPPIVPMGRVLKPGVQVRAEELATLNKRRFLYAKIGSEDAFAFPDLCAGSIVRIDARPVQDLLVALGPSPSKDVFAVADRSSLHCGHLRRIAPDRMFLCSTHFPFSQLELTQDLGFRVFGIVDAEIRPLGMQVPPSFSTQTTTTSEQQISFAAESNTNLKELVRLSRIRVGLSFRQASLASQWVAATLGDSAFFAGPGTLSDYEKLCLPPRRLQKIFCLCILYCIGFWDFFRAAGLSLDRLGTEPLSDELRGRRCPPQAGQLPRVVHPISHVGGAFLSGLLNHWEEIPLFMKDALGSICGLKNLSSFDVFWVGGDSNPIHPFLVNASFIAVNRRVKNPIPSAAKTLWEQPLYVLLKRDGGYLCGCCTMQRGLLTVHCRPHGSHATMHFKNGIDAEVVGRVTAILRQHAHS